MRNGELALCQVERQGLDPGDLPQAVANLAFLARAVHLVDVEDRVRDWLGTANQWLPG